MYFCTLPETVSGYSVTSFMNFGILQNAILSLQQANIDSFVSWGSLGSLTLTTAATYSPYFQSDTLTTWASRTPGILTKNYQISLGQMFSPPLIIISLILPTIDRYPFASITPKSPDFIQPSCRLLLLAYSSSQQFSITAQPFTQNYPVSPALHWFPSESTILAYSPGSIWPTVVVLRWRGSVGQVWKDTGEVSVIPQQLVMSLSFRSLRILFISSYEHNDPATIPVRRLSRLYRLGFSSNCLKYQINMVGTPYREVHLYLVTASRVFLGSKPSVMIEMPPPRVKAPRVPKIFPKQWQKGTERAMLSTQLYLHFQPIANPLLRMLQWDRVAALGLPVVPEVNWIFAGSLRWMRLGKRYRLAGQGISVQLTNPLRVSLAVFILMTPFREGNLLDCRSKGLLVCSSGRISSTILRQLRCLKVSLRKSRLSPTLSMVQASQSLWQAGLMLTRMRSATAAAI